MSLAAALAGVTFLTLAALALALLLLPLRLWLVARSTAGGMPGQFRVRLGLLGGAVPWIPLSGGRARPGPRDEAPQAAEPPRRRGTDRERLGRMLRALPALLRGLLGPVRIVRLQIDGRFGLGDPAATGEVFGALAPLLYGGGGLCPGTVRLVPVFDDTVLDGEIEVVLSVVPLRWLGPLLRFGWAAFGPRPAAARPRRSRPGRGVAR